MAGNAINMCDKDILEDFLSSQKQITANYNLYAGECEHTNLRDTFLGILSEEHCIQTELFDEMHNRGWYPVKAAEQAQIDAVRQKFAANG
ncbi:MAG: spore coat protein [Clostridiaceae bacterium]|nr:spore coat protein [Clostridiales bacterium]MDD6877413.1 spore coat protein [Clostridiaceae bacterium]MDY3072020.1 spore coat protein [Eubacteriales bacterium]MDY3287133.1 spore coat protein [Eubacteriales bacterium]MDY5016483.1 spore coat protein [Eubacteriales bacterium]